MGSRNLDRIPIRMWRSKAETVADMLAQKWEVITSCQKCGLAMVADPLSATLRRPEGGFGWQATTWTDKRSEA